MIGRNNSYSLAIIVSVAMHLALLAAVTWGWSASQTTQKVYVPKFIEAKLVTIKAQTPKKAAPKKKPKKIDLAAKRRAEANRKKLADQKRKAAAMKKEADRKAAEKKKAEALKKEQARLAAEELARQKALEQQRLDEQRIRQNQEEFFDELEAEDELMLAEENEQKAQSYVSKISSRIEQNWSRPPSARRGMKCELLLSLVPTGKVVNVSIVKGSGNSAFDRSAELAVTKAERFPELQGMDPVVFERYFRQLRIVFNPQDLRL